MKIQSSIVVALLTAGCSAAGDPTMPYVGPPTLSPDIDIWDQTEAGATAWRNATGLELNIGVGGIPVLMVYEIPPVPIAKPDGTVEYRIPCGDTGVRRTFGDKFLGIDYVRVTVGNRDIGCPDIAVTIAHEIGHVLCDWQISKREPNQCHTSGRSLMAPSAQIDNVKIDEASALSICSRAECQEINL